jgi:type I restriction enzyme S subunit
VNNVGILPHTWCDAKISEITSVNPTLNKADISDDLDISFVPMPAVQAESGIIDVTGIRKFSEVKKGYTPFREGDVLFAKITPCMENGKMAVVPEVINGIGFGSTEFHVLRALFGVNAKYVYYYVSSQSFRREAEHNMSGAVGQRRVTTPYLSSCEIPLPPTNEQHRIVAKIEELFSELDKGIENLKTACAQLKVYRQALLKHAFAGKGLAQKGIIAQPFGEECLFSLSDVIQSLGQGWSPRCLETPSPSDDEWGVIKTTAIQPLNFDDTKNKQLPVGLTPRPHLEIIPGDVLITRAGPRTRVGIACFVKSTRPRLMVCDKAYRLQVQKEKILPQYLVMLLNTSEVLSELEKLKSGISDSGLNLTQEKFLTLKVIVPSLKHQQIILDDVEEKLTNVAFLEDQIDETLKQSEALRQSILKKAFSGQLVPQDSHDEPASALLPRIKAEKSAQPTSKKART